MNPEWEVDKRKCWGRTHRPEADNPADSQVSQPQNLQSTFSPSLFSFPSTKQPPLPCLLAPTLPLEKLHFNNPHAPPTFSIRVAVLPHTRITRILPGPLPLWPLSRGPRPGHTYLPASPPSATYFRADQHDVQPTANIKLFFHHCKNYLLPFLHSSKLLSPFPFLSHIQNTIFKKSFNTINKYIFYSVGT